MLQAFLLSNTARPFATSLASGCGFHTDMNLSLSPALRMVPRFWQCSGSGAEVVPSPIRVSFVPEESFRLLSY